MPNIFDTFDKIEEILGEDFNPDKRVAIKQILVKDFKTAREKTIKKVLKIVKQGWSGEELEELIKKIK